MFRLFLKKKIFEGDTSVPVKAEIQNRNRRIFERYDINHKHLTVMNEQDIFLIREISHKGFSTTVSERTYERLALGDQYEARIRYLGDIFDLQVRVAWKAGSSVGFEITEANKDTLSFVNRILRPVEIAASLKKMDDKFITDQTAGKTWYKGDHNSDLFTWHDRDNGHLEAWQLSIGSDYVEWTASQGVKTGTLSHPAISEALMGQDFQGNEKADECQDAILDDHKKQVATDVIMALPLAVRDEILDTITR